MSSIPERRRVIEQARDSAKPAVSSRITSILDHSSQIPGFIIYLPVYRYGAPIATVEERRAAIQGVVAARFNAYELIENTLRRVKRHPQVDVEIFDGTVLTAEHLYYNDDDILQAQNAILSPCIQRWSH